MEALSLFKRGLLDFILALPRAFKEITNSMTLLMRTVQVMLINGGIFLGSVLLYKLVMGYLLVEDVFHGASILLIFVRLMMTAVY